MRVLPSLLLAVAALVLLASPAAASCAARAPVADSADRAVAVVYGTVTASGEGALTVRVERVLKGQVAASIRVFVGPGRHGPGGTASATSIDYPDLSRPAAVGSDHVLYLTRGSDGQLETNACIGSHAGPPDAAELAFFAAGSASSALPATPVPPAPEAPERLVFVHGDPSALAVLADALWPVLALLILAGVTFAVLRRRAARPLS
jgi:hypothetical protein